MITPAITLATSPPPASSAVIDKDVNRVGNRAATARATDHGEGSMKGGTRKIHRTDCHNSSKAAKTHA
jgi:hypothetical protein